MMTTLAKEEENKRKGMRISIILHLLLLLIAFYYLLPEIPEPKPQPYAVQVEFTYKKSSLGAYAKADQGTTRPKTKPLEQVSTTPNKPIEVKQAEVKLPEKPKVTDAKPTDPIRTDNTQKNSPVEITTKDVSIDVSAPDITFDTELDEVPEEILVTVPTPVPSPKPAESPASGGSKPGTADGPPSDVASTDAGTGKGSVGTDPGQTQGNQGNEGQGARSSGTGDYDDSGDGVFGRKVKDRNLKGVFSQKLTSGRTVMKVCINRAGMVTFIEVLQTTITDRNSIKKLIQAAQGYKYEADYSAPKEQCGKLTFDFDINALLGGND